VDKRQNFNRFYNPYYYEMSRYDYPTGDYSLLCTNETSGPDYLDYDEGNKVTNVTFYFEAWSTITAPLPKSAP
jgi:hypothetical protein